MLCENEEINARREGAEMTSLRKSRSTLRRVEREEMKRILERQLLRRRFGSPDAAHAAAKAKRERGK